MINVESDSARFLEDLLTKESSDQGMYMCTCTREHDEESTF